MRKNIKQLLAAVLVIAMMATLLVVPAAAADPEPGDVGYVWNFKDESEFQTNDYAYGNSSKTSNTYKGLEMSTTGQVGSYNGQYCYVGNGATLGIPVNGPCKVKITTQYGATGTMGVDSDTVALSASGSSLTPFEYTYNGDSKGTVTISSTGSTYLTQIELLELPADDEYTITAPATAVVKVGETVSVAVSADKDGEVYATTEDTDVITLSDIAEGKLPITGVKAGEATVTLGVTGGKGSKEIKVTVLEPVTGPVTKWDFSAVDFSNVITNTDTEYNGLKLTNVKSHNGKYAHFGSDAVMQVPVSGPCAVIVNCEYGNHGTVGDKALEGDNNAGIDTTIYYYTGEAGYVDIARTDGDLYLTSVELATTNWDFSATDFLTITNTDTEYNGLTLVNVKSHNDKYAHFGSNATMGIPVLGPCDVTINCEYGNQGTVGVGEDVIDLEGDNDAGIDTTVYHYAGPDAGTVTVTRGGNLYLTSVTLSAYTDPSAQIKLSAEKADLELGGQAVEITAEVVNGTATGAMTAAVAEGGADMVTAAVAEGKITLTPGTKAGKTTVTVSTAVEGVADPVTAEIAVTVIDPNVVPTEWDFRVGSADELASAMRGLISEAGTSSKPAQYHGSTYGAYFFTGNYIDIPVAGPSTVTVTGGYEWHFGMGSKTDSTLYGTADGKEGNGSKTGDEVFTYTGGEGYVRLTSMGPNTSYVAAIKVEALENVTPNAVDVWDFGAEALDTALFTNKLTVDIMNSWYPAEVVAGSSGNNFPKEGFDTGELVFKTGADEATQTANNRLRTDNAAVTRHSDQTKLGAVDADPYVPNAQEVDAETKQVIGGEFYHGLIYSNGSGNQNINLTLKAKAGDKITYISSSNGGAAEYAFKDAEGTILGTGDFAPAGKVNAVPLTFYAPADGDYTYAINNQEKLVVCRIYREPGVKVTVTGNVDQTKAEGLTGAYSVVFTGPGGVQTKAPVENGKYTIELNNYLAGADYVVSLEGADGYIVASGEEMSVEMADRTATHDIIVASVDLVSVTGKVAGLTEADLANLKLVITKPEDKIYQPKIVPAEDGSFTASFEKGVEYAVTALNVNDYELVKDKLSFTADTASNVVFVPKTTYAITVVPDPADVDLTGSTFTFINKDEVDEAHPDGYTYTFSGADGIKLRDGQYVVEAKAAAAVQKLTPDLLVSGADTQCPVPFLNETPTLWDFADTTWSSQSGEVAAYNGLVLSGVQVNKTYALGSAGATIQVPVDGNCTVSVSYCYKASGTVGDVTFGTESGSTSTIETTTYKYTGGKGTVEIKYADQSYLTKIEVIKSMPYTATVTVGADKQFETINEALAAVKTMDRTDEQRVTIEIDPGDYEEMLRIDVPNITLKNAAATPSIELKNKGVDIDANAVRITHYYGHGYAYYSMEPDCSYSAERLAINKANGRLSFENPGTGTTSGSYWNATVRVMADGVRAEGIIFENSFNQYVSKKAAEDVIIPLQGAKEGAVPRAEMKTVGDTTVQHKEYVERAAALAINDNCKEIFFDNCRFVGRQDTLYGGKNATVGFYDCAVMGGTDYIFGPMIAVFAKCDLVFNTNDETEAGQKNDVGYITAPQQTAGRGYLMYNCHVTSTTPGVDTASKTVSKPGTFGRPWAANTGEAVFYATDIDATDPIYYTGDTAKGTSMIQGAGWFDTLSGKSGKCGDFGTVEYYQGADTTADRASWAAKLTEAKTADGADLNDTTAWLGGWNAFDGKDMTIANQTPKAFDAATLKTELEKAIEAAKAALAAAPEEKADDVAAADVDRGTQFVHAADKTAFQTAIDAAQAVVDNASATQADVLAGQKALAAAVRAFNAAVKDGAKAPDTAGLEAALATAAAAKSGVVVTAGPADKVTKDVSFAPKTAFDALNAAIKAAEDVRKGVASTQKDVDDAKTALEAAITAFNAAKGVGTKAADAASLKAAIEAAKAAKEGVEVNAGPADQVDSGVKFVTDKAVIDALDAAIAAAQPVADKQGAAQAELDAALKALTIATTDFEASVLTGTKGGEVPGVDKTELDAAVKAAEGVYAIGDDVVIKPANTKPSAVDKGQKFVTADKLEALAKAIADAKAVLDNKDATEEDVTKALADLKAAQDAFKVLTGTKGGSSSSGGRPSSRPTETEQPTNLPFTDVKADDWFYSSVKKAFDKGLMKGTSESTFAPTAKTTRAMVATILYRLAGEKKTDVENLFNDVAADTWYTDAVAWAAEQGIIKGYNDTTFGPENNVTREQLVVMLYRYANATVKEGRDLSAFHDAADVSAWAVEAMTWAVDKGIILGRGNGQLDPTGLASRAEVCTVLVRFLEMK